MGCFFQPEVKMRRLFGSAVVGLGLLALVATTVQWVSGRRAYSYLGLNHVTVQVGHPGLKRSRSWMVEAYPSTVAVISSDRWADAPSVYEQEPLGFKLVHGRFPIDARLCRLWERKLPGLRVLRMGFRLQQFRTAEPMSLPYPDSETAEASERAGRPAPSTLAHEEGVSVGVPCWFLVLLFSLPALARLAGQVRRSRRRRQGRCVRCAYDLRATPGRPCPECGTAPARRRPAASAAPSPA